MSGIASPSVNGPPAVEIVQRRTRPRSRADRCSVGAESHWERLTSNVQRSTSNVPKTADLPFSEIRRWTLDVDVDVPSLLWSQERSGASDCRPGSTVNPASSLPTLMHAGSIRGRECCRGRLLLLERRTQPGRRPLFLSGPAIREVYVVPNILAKDISPGR